MKRKIEEVGIHFSKRRTYRQKHFFLNRLITQLSSVGCEMNMIEKNSKTDRSNHLVVGSLKKSKIVIVAAYDTGSKHLNPFYTYQPLNSRHNYKEEMRNIMGYSILTIIVISFAILFTKWGFRGDMLQKAAVIIFNLSATILVFRWVKKPDNKFNMNRNSAAVSVMYESIERIKKGCYVFLDNAVKSDQGYHEFSKEIQDQHVIVLDCIAKGEHMCLAYRIGMEQMAKKIKDAFELPIELIPLEEKQYRNTPLSGFKNGYMLTSGELCKGMIYVKKVRNASDVEIDLVRLEKVEKGLEELFS